MVVAELDEGGGGEHAVGVHGEVPVLERVEVAHDEQQIRGLFDRQKSVKIGSKKCSGEVA